MAVAILHDQYSVRIGANCSRGRDDLNTGLGGRVDQGAMVIHTKNDESSVICVIEFMHTKRLQPFVPYNLSGDSSPGADHLFERANGI
jgi:hypothetical protein